MKWSPGLFVLKAPAVYVRYIEIQPSLNLSLTSQSEANLI